MVALSMDGALLARAAWLALGLLGVWAAAGACVFLRNVRAYRRHQHRWRLIRAVYEVRRAIHGNDDLLPAWPQSSDTLRQVMAAHVDAALRARGEDDWRHTCVERFRRPEASWTSSQRAVAAATWAIVEIFGREPRAWR